MARCSKCGKYYDETEAEEKFELSTDKYWSCFQLPLCFDCAVEAIEIEDGEVYQETCERCNKRFNPWQAETEFEFWHRDDAGAHIGMFGEILCADCANEVYDTELSDYYPREDEI